MQQTLGAQLYTVRQFTQTLDDIERSLEKIALIGYTAIQISAFGPVEARDVARLVHWVHSLYSCHSYSTNQ